MNWTDLCSNDELASHCPERTLRVHYYDALNSLFRVENALRLLVFVVLKANVGARWTDECIEDESGGKTTIGAVARRRKSQDQNYGYLGYPVSCPLMFLTAGELVRVILAKSTWPHFKPYFAASIGVVESKLLEISNIRNRFAHFRPIRPDDAVQIRINATHVLSHAEQRLSEMMGSVFPVPSNHESTWYRAIQGTKSDHCTVSLFQSADREWVRAVLTYRMPRWDLELGPGADTMITADVDVPAVLQNYPATTGTLVYAAERLECVGSLEDPCYIKRIRFIFPTKRLDEMTTCVSGELRDCVAQLDSDIELISEDPLADGVLAKPRKIKTEAYWLGEHHKHWPTRSLRSPSNTNEFPEDWGTIGESMPTDFFSSTRTYPWMQVTDDVFTDDDIDDDIPF